MLLTKIKEENENEISDEETNQIALDLIDQYVDQAKYDIASYIGKKKKFNLFQ